MYYIEVAPTVLVRQDATSFTYAYDSPLSIGTIVTVSVGKKIVTGVVIENVPKPTFACKAISTVVEDTPLPKPLISTAQWIAAYYQVHLSTVLSTLLPSGVTKKRRTKPKTTDHKSVRANQHRTPTKSQQAVINAIINENYTTQILFGVTGSGKTLVYIECIKKLFKKGLSSIVLVPEISLTSQIVDEFKQVFGDDVLVSHSKQPEARRHLVWQQALRATRPKVVIGPRSALFLPLQHIGLIVLDEFHEPSYKQEQQPRYSSLRVATMLARAHGAKALFGSATPTVSEYYLSEKANTPILRLPTTAKKSIKPTISVVDMTKRTLFTKHRFFSDDALKAMDKALANNKQVLLFHNRRGTTSTTLCSSCGWSALDPDTDLPLTLHADTHLLISHVTGYTMTVPTSCPLCGSVDIIHKGIGTKLIESELKKYYRNKKIVRFDGDSERGSTVEERYDELYRGDIDIIIGTQVIAKGIDLPNLTTVCIVQADAGLALPDYTASERTFQLLTQAIGRVGRDDQPTTIVVQTYQPNHPAIIHGIAQDFEGFYATALAERKKGYFPPFAYLARFTCTYKTEAVAIKNSRALLKDLCKNAHSDVRFFGPAPAFYEKQHGTYRWNIIAKSPTRLHLAALAQHLPPRHWQFELDPISLL